MIMENITKETTQHIADLCNLKLSPNEIEKLEKMLSDTIGYIKILDELDTSAVSETYQVTGLSNVYQEADTDLQTLTQKEVLKNAPQVRDGKFVTKAVFER
jgi:aspartyl/glutamyl-tRNA(Asn/Gln) amidotransferase C subunit